jgi:hypothetical protein
MESDKVSVLIERISKLEAQSSFNTPNKNPEGEVWLVYDPNKIRVWCPKNDCPHLNRELEKESITQTVTLDENLAETIGGEVGDETEVDIEVYRISAPRADNHPLGVVAAFGSEREAAKWVTNFYNRNKYNPETNNQQFCIASVVI